MTIVVATLLALAACGGQKVSSPQQRTTLPGGAGVEVAAEVAAPTTLAPIVQVDTDPATFYVSSSVGNDAADGQTAATPWSSLQAAMDRLAAGQTLFVMDGHYDELLEPGNAHYAVQVSGTPDAYIRITAAPGQHPEIVASAGNGIVIRGDYVEISGLSVRGEGFSADNDYGWGMLIRNSHHVRIADSTVWDMAVGGISSVESSNLEILYNEVYDNSFWGSEQGSGISMWHSSDAGIGADADGYHDRIIGNRVYRNENKVFSEFREGEVITDGNGIILDQSKETGYTGRTLVANNVVFDNGGRGILVLESSRVDVIFNTTYRNGRTSDLEGGPVELVASRSDDVRLLNNLAWSRPGAPAIVVADAMAVELGGNVFITDAPSGISTEFDLVTDQDPGLRAPSLDPATADFRPADGSLTVGRGIVVSPVVALDADGLARSETVPDVGAYVYDG